MASDPVSLRGVVLQSREFKDHDRIISFLSSESGVIDICVKGSSGGKGSKFSAAAVPFIVMDVVITATGSFYYLKDFNIVFSNSGIMKSLEAMTCAGHIGKVLSSAYLDMTNAYKFYELAVYAFYNLSEKPDQFLLIYSAFNWRVLYLMGLSIRYDNCNNCKQALSGSAYLSFTDGQIYCADCFEHSNKLYNGDFFLLTHSAVLALDHFISCDIKQLFSVRLDESSLHKLVLFTTRYMNVQLESDHDSLLRLLKDLNVI